MDKQRIKGAKDRVEGTVKEKAGEMTGDRSTELKGKVQKQTGKVRERVGNARDEIRRKNASRREDDTTGV